jgi:hypothetical protein
MTKGGVVYHRVMRVHRAMLWAALAAMMVAAAACGAASGECDDDGASCRANPSVAALEATEQARLSSPTSIARTPVPPQAEHAVQFGSPTPEPPSTAPPPPTAIPSETATLVPPDPSLLATPRPTDAPFTPKRRPQLPAASDIHLDGDGKYVADVDGCHWAEFGRFPVAGTDEVEVGMQTSCLPDEGLHYNPRTGQLDFFIA